MQYGIFVTRPRKFNHITVRAICYQGNGDSNLRHSIDFAEERDGRLPFNLLNYITKVLEVEEQQTQW